MGFVTLQLLGPTVGGLMQQRISKSQYPTTRERKRKAGMNQTNQPGHIFLSFLFSYNIQMYNKRELLR
jgi:hypothetical protein